MCSYMFAIFATIVGVNMHAHLISQSAPAIDIDETRMDERGNLTQAETNLSQNKTDNT